MKGFWRIRVCIRGCGILHLVSSSEPVWDAAAADPLRWTPLAVEYPAHTELLLHTEYLPVTSLGDSLGYCDWSEVSAISWRYQPL